MSVSACMSFICMLIEAFSPDMCLLWDAVFLLEKWSLTKLGCCRFSIFPANIKPISVYSVPEAPTLLTLHIAIFSSIVWICCIMFCKFAEISNRLVQCPYYIHYYILFHSSFFSLPLLFFFTTYCTFLHANCIFSPSHLCMNTPQQIHNTYSWFNLELFASYSLATDNDGTINCNIVNDGFEIWTYYSRCCSWTPSEHMKCVSGIWLTHRTVMSVVLADFGAI